MKNEIVRDFYCSGFSENICGHYSLDHNCPKSCRQNHRKHPTPEQYKEEYGEDVPGNMPIWVLTSDEVWELTDYTPGRFPYRDDGSLDRTRFYGLNEIKKVLAIVVACTPFGKPDDTWRPQ